jgi:chemotaxis protein methyltransferase WspC
MALSQIIALLQQTIGLDVASVGVALIERAVKQRLNANELRNVSEYADLLRRSESELQNLIEAVVIPESFFFRYPEGFVALRQIVLEQFLLGSRSIRVISVPCSTGEEPFSIVMTLFDAGLSSDKFRIDAVDISARALDIAAAGVFGRNSFRGADLEFRDRYFEKANDGFRLCDSVRKCVQFDQGNVLEERFGFGAEPYDFIFCRNLLIYFDAQSQGRAIKNLKRLLAPDGLLFVGSAEAGLLSPHGFDSARLPMAFAFRHSDSVTIKAVPKLKQAKLSLRATASRTGPCRKPVVAPLGKGISGTAKQETKSLPDLELASRLADQGQLVEAAQICERSLREKGPSACAFYLLGLIRDCAGERQQADLFYRKALYLEPDHHEALIHLALLNEKSGNDATAKVFKDRARRLQERTK